MKINTGNFGNNGAQLGATHTDNPEYLAGVQAEKAAAQSTIEAQSTLQRGYEARAQAGRNQAQAMANVGQAVTGIGTALVDHAQALAKQKAELQLQDYSSFKQGVIQDIEQQVSDGNLDSTKIKDYYATKMAEWKSEDIPDLTGTARAGLDKGMQITDRQSDRQIENIYGRVVHIERVNAADQIAAGYAQKILEPGADIAQITGQVDEFYNRPATKALYGASWGTKYKAAKQSLQGNYFTAQVEAHQNDNGTLEQIRQGVLQTVEDPRTRTAILNTIDSKQSRNEAKAIAAQNHADSLATRREVAAVHTDDQMQQRIANGEIPTDQDWQVYEQRTEGTSVGGNARVLKATMATTQELYAKDPRVAQADVDAIKLRLDRNGGTAEDYKVYRAVQANVDKRQAMIKNDPQRVGAMDANTPLQPVRLADALNNPGALGEALTMRLQNSEAVGRKYGASAGKNLLMPEELADTKADYKNMTSDQRVQMWRNISASAGPEVQSRLASELGDGDTTVAAVSDLATTPNGYKAATTIEKGVSLLNPVDGAAKAEAPKEADAREAIQSSYPNMDAATVNAFVPVVQAHHVGSGKTKDDSISSDDMDQYVAQKVRVFGQDMYASPKVNANVFSDTLTKSVNRLPYGTASDIRNNIDRGTYTFIPDASGNMRLINKDTQRAVKVDGVPYVVGMPK